METTALAGVALLMKTSQTQQAMSVSLMKIAAQQQSQIAVMLETAVNQAPQAAPQGSGFNFSTYV